MVSCRDISVYTQDGGCLSPSCDPVTSCWSTTLYSNTTLDLAGGGVRRCGDTGATRRVRSVGIEGQMEEGYLEGVEATLKCEKAKERARRTEVTNLST